MTKHQNRLNRKLGKLLLICVLAVLLKGCNTLDPNPPKLVTHAIAPTTAGTLSNLSHEVTQQVGPEKSGFNLLQKPEDAMNWRLALLDHATQTVDIQYFLWEDDEAGRLLSNRVIDAAQRGVRVRILFDDFLYQDYDGRLAAICHHPNINIRVFNPTRNRSGALMPLIELAANFEELNHRMHNKTFIVDGRVAIMGGRNVGNPYFGLSEDYNFLDLDVVAVGPIVKDITSSFDEYWNSDPAYPAKAMSDPVSEHEMDEAISEIRQALVDSRPLLDASPYPLARKNWSRELKSDSVRWHAGTATMLADDPTIKANVDRGRFLDEAPSLAERPDSTDLTLVTAYFIPTEEIYQTVAEHIASEVSVSLIVPGLDATNHGIVHSHYRQHRKRLLRSGAQLYELRGDGNDLIRQYADVAPICSAKVALHVKAGMGDSKRSFIGSPNLDPRSIVHNTENGLLIESESLALEVKDFLDLIKDPENAWEVTLENDNNLVWRSRDETKRIQPAPNIGSRISDFFIGLLPVSKQL